MDTRRVAATPAALALIGELTAEHGPILFHQSGGCCDGSSPMCYPKGDLMIGDGQCVVEREGKFKKFVKQSQQITYSVSDGVTKRHQASLIVTERAVFEVTEAGLKLIEIAPGIDLQRDVLGQMEFTPQIADPLPLMDASLFKE